MTRKLFWGISLLSMLAISAYFLYSIWMIGPVFLKKTSGKTINYYDVVLDPVQQKLPNSKGNTGPINAPLIRQYPELARGCEVTSLAMMLQTAGVKVDKMILASALKKDPVSYSVIKGKIHFGNPNIGFVGDMYTKAKPGYGVYHGPLTKLAQVYLGKRVIDLTGQGFDVVLEQLDQGVPVVVITSTTFKKVPESEWQTWFTEKGPIQITTREHAVLLTGYSRSKIYLNDPLRGKKNLTTNRKDFIQAWKQFGEQAISYKAQTN